MPGASIEINQPAETVFAYVSDITRHPEWASHELVVEPADATPLGVGKLYHSHGVQFRRQLQDELTVTEYQAPSRFVFESDGKSGVWRHSLFVTPLGVGSCRVERRMDPVKLPLLGNLARPGIALGLPRRIKADLSRLKTRLEKPSP